MKKLLSLLQISLVLSLANPFITNARDLTWTGAASGNWNDSANFSPMFVPTANDTVTIDAATHHPRLTSNASAYRLVLLDDTLDLNGYHMNVSNEALFSGGWLEGGQLNCRGTIATFAGTVMDATIDVDCTTLELNGSVFNQSCYFKVETGESQGGNTFMAPVSLVHVGTSGSISMAMSQGDTFHDTLYVTNTSDGNIHLTQADTSHFKNCVHLSSTGGGSIHFGREGGISLLETNGHLVVENGEFTSGQLFIKNIEQQNTTGHRMVLTGTGSSDEHSLLALENGHFTGDVDFTAPNLLLSRSRFEGAALFTKTGGYDNVSTGDNLFSGDASFTNSSTTGHLLLTGSREDRFLGTAEFTSGSMRVISGYGATAVFEGDVIVNSSTVGFYRLKFTGEAEQTLSGTTGHLYGETELDKASGSVTATIPIAIDRRLTFTKGYLVTDSVNLITFLAGTTASGASDSSFVSGPVKKVGNTAFEFPVGKGSDFRPVYISASGDITDALYAEYLNFEHYLSGNLDTSLLAISNCNYWHLIQLNGESLYDVSFRWSGENCQPFDTSILSMAFLADTNWINIGHGSVSCSFTNGEITISDIADFGDFAFGTNAPEIQSQTGLTKNEGQLLYTNHNPADSVFYYCYHGSVDYYLFNTKIAFVYGFHDVENEIDSLYRMDLTFLDVNDSINLTNNDQIYYKNFYLGHTGSGLDSIGVFKTVEFNNIYEGVNLHTTISNGLHLEFIFNEGSSIDSVRIKFEGSDSIKLNQDGTIRVFAASRLLEFARPEGFQNIGESTYKVAVIPQLTGDTLTFSASYNPSYPLIINFGPRPRRGHITLNKWSTYIEGSSFFDGAEDLWLDSDDNIYMVGACINSDLPVWIGQYLQHSSSGITDAFLFKFNTNRGIDWGTFFGGDVSDNGTGVAVNSSGYVYIIGLTSSTNLPACTTCTADPLLKEDVLNLGNGFDDDIFIAKFGGNGKLDPNDPVYPDVFSTYFGGEGYEIARAITIDNNDNVYIGGAVNNTGGYTGTGSTSYGTFPEVILTGAYNQDFGQSVDLWDAFLLKIDDNNDVLWCTAIGGDSEGSQDMISALAFDSNNNIYATGVTNADGPSTIPQGPITANTSGKFPIADPDVMSSSDYTVGNSGGLDAFVIKFNSDGAIVWSTMYGGQGNENGYLSDVPSWNLADNYMNSGIAVNSNGDIYITGSTTSDAYGSFPDFPQRVLTGSVNYYNQSQFNNGTCGGTSDAFIAMFNSDFELEWSTFYGGCGNEAGVAIACDKFDGHTYITGFTTSSDFPIKATTGAHSQSLKGSSDAFVLGFLNNARDYAMYFGGTGGPTEIGKGVITDDYGINLIFCGTSDDYNGPGTSDFPYSYLPGSYFWSTTGLPGDPNQKAYIANLRFGCNPC